MSDLLTKLNNLSTTLSPDEIVAAISPVVVFELNVFEPWRCPPGLEGRQVLIQNNDTQWWRSDGHGVTGDRENAVPWDIETAFNRFTPNARYSLMRTRLHLVPLGA